MTELFNLIETIGKIQKSIECGLSKRKICKNLGLTIYSLTKIIDFQKFIREFRCNTICKPKRDKLESMWDSHTNLEIAEEIGTSGAYVSQLGKKLGLPSRRSKRIDKDKFYDDLDIILDNKVLTAAQIHEEFKKIGANFSKSTMVFYLQNVPRIRFFSTQKTKISSTFRNLIRNLNYYYFDPNTLMDFLIYNLINHDRAKIMRFLHRTFVDESNIILFIQRFKDLTKKPFYDRAYSRKRYGVK
jgi:hypothetical protein